jgi:hypothetical protein
MAYLIVGHKATSELKTTLRAHPAKKAPRECGIGNTLRILRRPLRLSCAATLSKYFELKKS